MAIIEKNGVAGKICSHCKRWKLLAEFPLDPTHGTSQGGRHCTCKKCHRSKYREKRIIEAMPEVVAKPG